MEVLLSRMRPAPSAFAQTSGKGAVRGWGLTEARVRVRDGLAGVPVEEGSAAVAVLALGAVLAVFAHAPAGPAAGQVHAHVEVTAVRVAVTAASWERRGLTQRLTPGCKQPRWHPTQESPPLSSATPPSFHGHMSTNSSIRAFKGLPRTLTLLRYSLSEVCSPNISYLGF